LRWRCGRRTGEAREGGREGGREGTSEGRPCLYWQITLIHLYSPAFYPLFNVNRVAQGKQQPRVLGAVGGGCGCVEEVIQVAAAVGEKGGRGGEDDPRNPNSRV